MKMIRKIIGLVFLIMSLFVPIGCNKHDDDVKSDKAIRANIEFPFTVSGNPIPLLCAEPDGSPLTTTVNIRSAPEKFITIHVKNIGKPSILSRTINGSDIKSSFGSTITDDYLWEDTSNHVAEYIPYGKNPNDRDNKPNRTGSAYYYKTPLDINLGSNAVTDNTLVAINAWNKAIDQSGKILSDLIYRPSVIIKIVLDDSSDDSQNISFYTVPGDTTGTLSKYAVEVGPDDSDTFVNTSLGSSPVCMLSPIQREPDPKSAMTKHQFVTFRVLYVGDQRAGVKAISGLNIAIVLGKDKNGNMQYVTLPIILDPKIQNNG